MVNSRLVSDAAVRLARAQPVAAADRTVEGLFEGSYALELVFSSVIRGVSRAAAELPSVMRRPDCAAYGGAGVLYMLVWTRDGNVPIAQADGA